MSRIIEVCNFFETKGCFVFKQCTCHQGALSYTMSPAVSVVFLIDQYFKLTNIFN